MRKGRNLTPYPRQKYQIFTYLPIQTQNKAWRQFALVFTNASTATELGNLVTDMRACADLKG